VNERTSQIISADIADPGDVLHYQRVVEPERMSNLVDPLRGGRVHLVLIDINQYGIAGKETHNEKDHNGNQENDRVGLK
jgi:hypothetical protein